MHKENKNATPDPAGTKRDLTFTLADPSFLEFSEPEVNVRPRGGEQRGDSPVCFNYSWWQSLLKGVALGLVSLVDSPFFFSNMLHISGHCYKPRLHYYLKEFLVVSLISLKFAQ